jgi:transcriptional regulator with XRE-family HTH domain
MNAQVSDANTASGEKFRDMKLSEDMRRELADFLRTRREKLRPQDVGLPQTARRRTPGLRREEVADLAGVGTTWYTWLEQARDIQASSDILNRLANALRLTIAEKRHLFALSGKIPPTEALSDQDPSPGLLRVLNDVISKPAIIIGARWDVLAANEAAKLHLPKISQLAESRGNYIHHLLRPDNPGRERIVNWETSCRRLVAEFRASISDVIDHPWIGELIEQLSKDSPEFVNWWSEHDVYENKSIVIEIKGSAESECIRRERTILNTMDDSRSKIVIFNTLD